MATYSRDYLQEPLRVALVGGGRLGQYYINVSLFSNDFSPQHCVSSVI